MSHIMWSVSLSVCVCWGHGWAVQKTAEPIMMPFGGLIHVSPGNHVLDGSPDLPREGALLRGTYTSSLRIVCVPPRANVPAQRPRRTNAFTAMRPFTKLLRTFVFSFHSDVNDLSSGVESCDSCTGRCSNHIDYLLRLLLRRVNKPFSELNDFISVSY